MFENASKKMQLDKEFTEAVFQWNVERVKEIFAEGKELYPNINQELVTAPAILLAAIKQNWDMFEALYELNANLDVKSINNGWHLIHECVKNAPLNISESILEYCNLNVQTEDGRTALMVAIKEKKESLALSIIDNGGLNVSLVDKNGDDAGHYAAKSGMHQVFLRLIKEGLPLNRKNKKGEFAADLIEDEFFKAALPQLESNANKEANAIKATQEANNPVTSKEESKALTGLSIVKKKF